MKVLQIINSPLIGGAEKVVKDLCVSLNENNIQTDVLFLSKSNSISFFDVNSGYDIKYPQFNCSIYNPFLIFLILKHIRKYDIINVHLFPALYIVAFTKFLFSNKKILVFTEHSTNNRRMHNRFYKWIDQFVYKQYNKIVTISNDLDFAIKNHLGFRL